MKVNTAIITAAGFGTRFLPIVKEIPKEMLPIVDKPIIQYVVEECLDAGIETIIITGENSAAVKSRAEKLKMTEFYLGVKKKEEVLEIIKQKNGFTKDEIAYIGDDSNDYDVMKLCGFTATPNDGMSFIKDIADYVCETKAGNGAFREFAELILAFKNNS